ncbi:MAG: GIY-YIG nuclease family protein [Paludibacteraceae bacterium]|nr:GIY-YIG nuclease family protein [Paludibacteraceae bacterium]
MNQDFFPIPPKVEPTIYAYSEPQFNGLLKVGYTGRQSVADRVRQQHVNLPTRSVQIVLQQPATRPDGSSFTDHEVHRWLRSHGVPNPKMDGARSSEWFECDVAKVQAAILAVRNRDDNEDERTESFGMRPEQQEAVNRSVQYFRKFAKAETDGRIPHFLWNCKMRFGKTFAAYQLARKMKWTRLLVLTFKPAVESAWSDDLLHHTDFKGWQFISRNSPLQPDDADPLRPIVCFGSFQDYLGRNSMGGIKAKNEWVHATHWDCVVLDEYHYGAWDDNAKALFDDDCDEEMQESEADSGSVQKNFDENLMPIKTDAYLYLSGTPFRALNSGEFNEEQIYNWTYADEQNAKLNWNEADGPNPYAALPRMVLMTYQLPDEIRHVATLGEFNEFDLNAFFEAEGVGDKARFHYEDSVQKWLDLIRGAYKETIVSDLKLRTDKPPMPYSHAPLLKTLSHTLWLFRSVASCYAMRNLLMQPQNRFYHDYKVVLAAGSECGVGLAALGPVREAMGVNPLVAKTITLSCGKLTTGVTIRPWTGILMLCNLSSPESYFQSAFRVQSPWTVRSDDASADVIVKQECYVFDFAPNRALKQIAHYSQELNVEEPNPERKVADFIKFLPVLAYDGFSMKRIDPAGILDIAASGTSATLLARRWESALLVNVDNVTLRRLMNSEQAMKALMSIEAFRSLNADIETIINKSDELNKRKTQANDNKPTAKEKKEMTEDEKEIKSKRKEIQDKLIKFATRIPIFMYLTDYREVCLRDVITKLEPKLFKKVTGLSVLDFDLLLSLGIFNSQIMNEAVFRFKCYEDSSLCYTGIDSHEADNNVGGFDTSISKSDYNQVFTNL